MLTGLFCQNYRLNKKIVKLGVAAFQEDLPGKKMKWHIQAQRVSNYLFS